MAGRRMKTKITCSSETTNHAMTYPLGSFPRFGHQQRWALGRGNRAILNSILTRQTIAAEHLRKERSQPQQSG
jgi:hypothetical protein